MRLLKCAADNLQIHVKSPAKKTKQTKQNKKKKKRKERKKRGDNLQIHEKSGGKKKKRKKKNRGPATLNPENTVEENLNYFFMLLNQHIDMGEVNILLELF